MKTTLYRVPQFQARKWTPAEMRSWTPEFVAVLRGEMLACVVENEAAYRAAVQSAQELYQQSVKLYGASHRLTCAVGREAVPPPPNLTKVWGKFEALVEGAWKKAAANKRRKEREAARRAEMEAIRAANREKGRAYRARRQAEIARIEVTLEADLLDAAALEGATVDEVYAAEETYMDEVQP